MRGVPSTEPVFTNELVDFRTGQPAWRLYMISDVMAGLLESSSQEEHRRTGDEFEAQFRTTPWGALYFALSERAPESAERTALRLRAVLSFWDSLQHERYLYKKLNTFLTLEELLASACGWALNAWHPEGEGSIRSRFEVTAERMARATREECVEAILRQLPHVLPLATGRRLNRPEIVTRLESWREHLPTLDDAAFERISGACPGWVLHRLYVWDEQL